MLLIYKSGCECKHRLPLKRHLAQCDLANFPHSLWGVVQSAENLTPRGLSNAFSSNDMTGEDFLKNHQLDSFLLSKRRDDQQTAEEQKGGDPKSKSPASQFKYMIFVWNGK